MKHAHAPCTYGHHGYLFEFRKYKKHSHYRDTPNLKDEGRQHRLMHTNRVLWLRGTCGKKTEVLPYILRLGVGDLS